MTSADTSETLIYYPQYCFHLSPTINKWCPLQATDIASLACRPGFEGQDVYFHLNHPIRWVRITGIVVAIDEYPGRRIYTVDDSTGACIECTVTIPRLPDPRQIQALNSRAAASGSLKPHIVDASTDGTIPDVPADIDIGEILDVKGSVKLFRGQKQIAIQKVQRVKSTNQEVQFWNKIKDFRRDVLSNPWVLDRKEVRRCKKLQQMDSTGRDRRRERKAKEKDQDSTALAWRANIGKEKGLSDQGAASHYGETISKSKKTYSEVNVEKSGKSGKSAEGQYNALGL
ncbi:hypothetical protein F5Y15DRAFT_289091 [Xylariaceae sp. FL0016]|nr:hypothetical protein F5Y15DRAFT_289091 [Xylariaceae sp. FL0016]